MGRIKEFYHEEICKAAQDASEGTFNGLSDDPTIENLPRAEEMLNDAEELFRDQTLDLFDEELPSWIHDLYS